MVFQRSIEKDSNTDSEICFRYGCERVRKLSSSDEDNDFNSNQTENVPGPIIWNDVMHGGSYIYDYNFYFKEMLD